MQQTTQVQKVQSVLTLLFSTVGRFALEFVDESPFSSSTSVAKVFTLDVFLPNRGEDLVGPS